MINNLNLNLLMQNPNGKSQSPVSVQTNVPAPDKV